MNSKDAGNSLYALLVIGGVTWWWWSDKQSAERAKEGQGQVYVTTMEELQAAYEANEVAAQQKIGDSLIEVTAVVKSINAAMGGDSASIDTEGGGTIRLAGEERSSAAKLHKGDKTTFRCSSMNFVLGSPYGDHCVVVR